MRVILILAVTLAGCASPVQKPAHVSDRDWQICRYEAMKVEASNPNPIIGMQYAMETMKMCLNMRGY